MKRSEMVELLLEYDDELLPMQAEDIIDFLVEQGMQPSPYAKAINNGEYFTFVHEWEPEITQQTIDEAMEHIGKKGVRGEMEITE